MLVRVKKKQWFIGLIAIAMGTLLVVLLLRGAYEAQIARVLGFHATDWPAFWLSFWAAASSGLLYSLIIGFALWWTQRSSDERRERRQYAENVAVFQAHLRAALAYPEVSNVSSLRATASRRSLAVAAELENKPIAQWRRQLREQHDFFDKVAQFEDAYFTFIAASENLEVWLQDRFRVVHRSWAVQQQGMGVRRTVSDEEQRLYKYVIARVVGETSSDAQRLSEAWDEWRPEHHYDAVAHDPKVAPLLTPFTEARRNLDETTDALKNNSETWALLSGKRGNP